jgi:2-polyprenyl-6-methoxyphenol hydroxylase-like FAD-dependent oxidoreductase
VTTRPQHVVFGAGAIGLALTEALQRRGETGIRLINRSGSAPVADDVEVVGGARAGAGRHHTRPSVKRTR